MSKNACCIYLQLPIVIFKKSIVSDMHHRKAYMYISTKPLLLLQKKLVRIMTFSTYYAHTDLLFKNMEILIINRLVIHRIGILMYKLNCGLLSKVLCNFFKKNNEIHNYNTRTKNMFRISHESQTFSSVGVKLWYALSIKIDVNVTLIKFKESLYPK